MGIMGRLNNSRDIIGNYSVSHGDCTSWSQILCSSSDLSVRESISLLRTKLFHS